MVEAIRADMRFSYGAMGTISGFVQAGFMVCALLAGILTVRFGALPLILGSIAFCAIGLGGLSFATNIVVMAAILIILGGCAAAIWVPMVEVAREIIPKAHQAKALGLMSSGTSYGVFVNSLLQTNVLDGYGWRSLWMITCILVALLALWGMLRLRQVKSAETADAAARREKPTIGARLREMPKGLALAVLFMMFLNGLSCMPYQTYLSAFLQNEAGYTNEMVAYAWRIIGVVGMVSGFAIGALADRITVRWGMLVTYLILATSCFMLIIAADAKHLAALYVATVTFGVSFYAIFGLVPAYISQMFGTGGAALVFAFGNIGSDSEESLGMCWEAC